MRGRPTKDPYTRPAINTLERLHAELGGKILENRLQHAELLLPGGPEMSSTAIVLDVKCFNCQEPLIRLTRSETDDFVFCPICGGVLTYEEVVENAPGLIGGTLTVEELNQLRIEAGLSPK